MIQGHRYLEPPILYVQSFTGQTSTFRLPEPTPLTVYRAVTQVPPPLDSIMVDYTNAHKITYNLALMYLLGCIVFAHMGSTLNPSILSRNISRL